MVEWIFKLVMNIYFGISDYLDDSNYWFDRFFRPITITVGIFSAIILVILLFIWIF